MNLRNELQQTRDEDFVSYARNQPATKLAVGPEAAPATLSDVVERVNSAISKLHYLPNEHAIKLRRGKGKGLPNGVIQMSVLLEEKSVRQWRPLDEVLRSPVPTGQRTLSEDECAKVRSLLAMLYENLELLENIIR
jgi:hypothetical protein